MMHSSATGTTATAADISEARQRAAREQLVVGLRDNHAFIHDEGPDGHLVLFACTLGLRQCPAHEVLVFFSCHNRHDTSGHEKIHEKMGNDRSGGAGQLVYDC